MATSYTVNFVEAFNVRRSNGTTDTTAALIVPSTSPALTHQILMYEGMKFTKSPRLMRSGDTVYYPVSGELVEVTAEQRRQRAIADIISKKGAVFKPPKTLNRRYK